MAHPELAYSFRRVTPVVSVATESDYVLARVEQLLIDAGKSFAGRRYSEAITRVKEARELLWRQLFPTSKLREPDAWQLDLFPTFVSYGGEWLNLLPIELPEAEVRPRVEPPPDPTPRVGLTSDAIDADGLIAVADLRAAELLGEQGNLDAAKFFRERAATRAPELVDQLAVAGEPITPPAVPDPPDRLGGRRTRLGRSDLSGGSGRRGPVDLRDPAVADDRASTVRRNRRRPGRRCLVDRRFQSAGRRADRRVLRPRRSAAVLPDLLIRPDRAADAAVALAHAWHYETALGLAECYHTLGDWETAETWYERVARYQYLNEPIEAVYVWGRLASLYRDWGDSLYRAGQPGEALPLYERVLTSDGNPGASALYTITGLQSAADVARQVIDALATSAAIVGSPAIAGVICDIRAQLAKISGGLDFWGHWAANVPIWTFDYLQSVATNFCHLAIGAERDAIAFWDKAENGSAHPDPADPERGGRRSRPIGRAAPGRSGAAGGAGVLQSRRRGATAGGQCPPDGTAVRGEVCAVDHAPGALGAAERRRTRRSRTAQLARRSDDLGCLYLRGRRQDGFGRRGPGADRCSPAAGARARHPQSAGRRARRRGRPGPR